MPTRTAFLVASCIVLSLCCLGGLLLPQKMRRPSNVTVISEPIVDTAPPSERWPPNVLELAKTVTTQEGMKARFGDEQCQRFYPYRSIDGCHGSIACAYRGGSVYVNYLYCSASDGPVVWTVSFPGEALLGLPFSANAAEAFGVTVGEPLGGREHVLAWRGPGPIERVELSRMATDGTLRSLSFALVE